MKLKTAVVYDLKMWIKEDNPGPKKLREIIICEGWGNPLWFDSQF